MANRINSTQFVTRFDPEKHLCCHGEQAPVVAGLATRCCSYASYDSRTNFCYKEKVYPKCAAQEYDPLTYICCEDHVAIRSAGRSSATGKGGLTSLPLFS